MKLKEIISGLDIGSITGDTDIEIGGIEWNFYNVKPNDLFINPCATISETVYRAIKRGAAAVIMDAAFPLPVKTDVTLITVYGIGNLAEKLCRKFYGDLMKQMTVIGVTGTKGKTTTASMIYSMMKKSGLNVGLQTTIGTYFGDKFYPSGENHPHDFKIYSEMAAAGVRFLIWEVHFITVKCGVAERFHFDTCVYTNLSPDHYGEYGGKIPSDPQYDNFTFDDYAECKARLFRLCDKAIINGDNLRIYADVKKYAKHIETFGLSDKCNIYAENLQQAEDFGVSFEAAGDISLTASIPCSGTFSVYNALAAISVCRQFGVKNSDMQDVLEEFHLSGRMEEIPFTEGIYVFIDYAHNGASLENALRMLRSYNPKRLVCLIGLGGDRPLIRRTDIGHISGKLADYTVITSSNPRNEDPMKIIGDIENAICETGGEYTVIPDRTAAIEFVLSSARRGDIILLAGKGHEQYTEIKENRIKVSDKAVVENYIRKHKSSRFSQ